MAEYIRRDAAANGLAKIINESDMPEEWNKGMSAAMSALFRIPAADVRPVVRGKWVDDKGNPVPWDKMNKNCPNNSAYCSVCGEWLTASDEYPAIGNYCPNCGAMMREES